MPPDMMPLLLATDLQKAGIQASYTDATSLAHLRQLVDEATVTLSLPGWTARRFDDRVETRRYTALDVSDGGDLDGRELVLDADLRAVVSLTNGDGTVIGSSAYQLRPQHTDQRGVTAYRRIRLIRDGGAAWTYSLDPVDALQVAGRWGYGGVWVLTGTTLSAAITSESATTCTVVSGALVETGMVVRFGTDAEYAYVSGVATNTVTLERGAYGTTAATHLTGLAVYRWLALPLARRLALRLIQWMLAQNASPLAGQLVIGDMAFPVDTTGLPSDVVNLANQLRRVPMPVGV